MSIHELELSKIINAIDNEYGKIDFMFSPWRTSCDGNAVFVKQNESGATICKPNICIDCDEGCDEVRNGGICNKNIINKAPDMYNLLVDILKMTIVDGKLGSSMEKKIMEVLTEAKNG